ncbi:MAG: substrate-binding domain-containing protein [Rhizobiaceae bacterium]|nr:substrate-binding domain-containing protein [Rhizobiaceae bacterium]
MSILKNRKILKLSMATALTLGSIVSMSATAISQDKAPLKITMVAGVKGDPFYITMMCGAKKEATRLGATFDFQAPESFSPTDQIPIVNGVAAAQPDIMLIAPTHDSAMIIPIEQVAEGGTKIVLVDTSLQNISSTVAQISTDDYKGGVAAAEEIYKLTGGKGSVLLLNFQPGVSTTEARGRGFTEKAKELGLRVLDEQFSGTDIQKSTSIVSAVMQQASDLSGVFTTTDFGAQGTVAALRAANRLGEIKVVGFDASPVMVEQLKANDIQAIVSQKANEIGVLGVQQGVKAAKGEPTANEPIKVSTITITKDTLDNPDIAQALQETECRD